MSRGNVFEEDMLLANQAFSLVDRNGNYNAGRIQGGNIAAGESRTFVTRACVAPTNFDHCSGGTAPFQIGVFIDAGNSLPELRTDNNIDFRTIVMKCKN